MYDVVMSKGQFGNIDWDSVIVTIFGVIFVLLILCTWAAGCFLAGLVTQVALGVFGVHAGVWQCACVYLALSGIAKMVGSYRND